MAATNLIALRRGRTFNFYLTMILVYFLLSDETSIRVSLKPSFIEIHCNFKSNFMTKCLRRSITEWTKHGQICLHLPFTIDLTIHMDVERQPGPDTNVRVRDCLLHRYSNRNSRSDVLTYHERILLELCRKLRTLTPSLNVYARSEFK